MLVALADGSKDEAAARRLGMSRRTFRRRVRSAMERLGARSRFQAGLLWAQMDTHGQRDVQGSGEGASNREGDDRSDPRRW